MLVTIGLLLGLSLCVFDAKKINGVPKDWKHLIDEALLEQGFNADAESQTDDQAEKTMFQGDIRVESTSDGEFRDDSGITAAVPTGRLNPDQFWTTSSGGGIPYEISEKFNNKEKSKIKRAMSGITKMTTGCIVFQERRDEVDYISFTRHASKCSSSVGRQGGLQQIALASSCAKSLGRIEHEIMHALGIFHEQSRPDRDNFVTIIDENVSPEMQVNFQKLPEMDTYNTGYDISSVMHYAFNDFAIDKNQPTILPKAGKRVKMGQRDGISILDAAKLQLAYKCPIGQGDVPMESDPESVSVDPISPAGKRLAPATVDNKNLWPNGGKNIPYKIHEMFRYGDVQVILDTIQTITEQTSGCITFIPQKQRGVDRINFSKWVLCPFSDRSGGAFEGGRDDYYGSRRPDRDRFGDDLYGGSRYGGAGIDYGRDRFSEGRYGGQGYGDRWGSGLPGRENRRAEDGSSTGEGRGETGRGMFRRSLPFSCFENKEPIFRYVMSELGVPMLSSPRNNVGEQGYPRRGYELQDGRGPVRDDSTGTSGNTGSSDRLPNADVARLKAAYQCGGRSGAE